MYLSQCQMKIGQAGIKKDWHCTEGERCKFPLWNCLVRGSLELAHSSSFPAHQKVTSHSSFRFCILPLSETFLLWLLGMFDCQSIWLWVWSLKILRLTLHDFHCLPFFKCPPFTHPLPKSLLISTELPCSPQVLNLHTDWRVWFSRYVGALGPQRPREGKCWGGSEPGWSCGQCLKMRSTVTR